MKIETIKSGAPRPLANYNECFKVGPWVFAAGQIASDYKTGVAPEARRNPARGRTFRSGRTRPADGQSNNPETLSRIQSLADYTIDTLESSFQKRQVRRRHLDAAAASSTVAMCQLCRDIRSDVAARSIS